jgi:hypothetical protein
MGVCVCAWARGRFWVSLGGASHSERSFSALTSEAEAYSHERQSVCDTTVYHPDEPMIIEVTDAKRRIQGDI